MAKLSSVPVLPDSGERIAALADHHRSLLVEAGAGSGKTALMAGRVALLMAAGIHPKNIVAITFTEPAAAELQERIEGTVQKLLRSEIPKELSAVLPSGLTDEQERTLKSGAAALDEITCTTIHGFCQQLIKPYPVETGIDPGAAIIDPAAAELAYQDLMDAWLSARFGRDRGAEGLGRIPAITSSGGEEDFFAELLIKDPDKTIDLIQETARFLKTHRTAEAPAITVDIGRFTQLSDAITSFTDWYNRCGVTEPTTTELIEDLAPFANLAREASQQPLTGRRLAELLFHVRPEACKQDETTFKQWRRKGKWKDAGKAAGLSTAQSEQVNNAGETHYIDCGVAYQDFCSSLGSLAFQRFVGEFGALRELYRNYKRNAALLDFDDLLHHAADLLKNNDRVLQALAQRYPVILVDEFQDTDPLQAKILWRLAGEGDASSPWHERIIRPGALFLVGDPKQAIYRFRGADVETYLVAKRALEKHDPTAILDVSANFRSQPAILEFVNSHFSAALDVAQGQPGFTALTPIRLSTDEPSVAAFEIPIEDRHRPNGRIAVDLVRHEEASIVAKIVSGLIGSYPVWDKDQQSFRPARAGDIALLAPTGTSLWIYEQELERREVPIATQAGKGFFRRQEVQDLIAIARTIADNRDTLAFGTIIRGPLVGLTEEQIADEIEALSTTQDNLQRLNLWTDAAIIRNDVLKQTLTVLQNLSRKARRATPYQLLAEAIEELNIRPILKARHPRGAERALANVELVLEMARAYAGRGIGDFARALWQRWEDGDAQAEGRPDAEANAVSIITIHSSKGLEWPIVIPINSTTKLWSATDFFYRRSDDSVHFKVLGFPSLDYDAVSQNEALAVQRERIRLWYVALTRARDLLLLPKQSERIHDDWLSLINLNFESLPVFDGKRFTGVAIPSAPSAANKQNLTTWKKEAETIAAAERRISWHQPSRQEQQSTPLVVSDAIFVGTDSTLDVTPASNELMPQGGRERGIILHKIMEELLTGEISDDMSVLQTRASQLLNQLDLNDVDDAATGFSSHEMADAIRRTLQIPEIAELRPTLLPEFHVYAASVTGQTTSLTAGIADAVAYEGGQIRTVVDWKSDVNPTPSDVATYRSQVRDYLTATGATFGLIVFITSGRIERVQSQP